MQDVSPVACGVLSRSVMSDSLWPHGLEPARLLCPPGKNTGVSCHALLQGIIPTQGSNPGLPHCRWIFYNLSHQGSSRILEWVACPFSRGTSWPRNWIRVSCIADRFLAIWATREAPPVASVQFSSFQSLNCVRLFATPWITAHQASLSITNSRSLLKLMSIESVMPSGHLILWHPLLLLPPIPPSIRIFSNESTLSMRWPNYWSFSLSISLSNEHPGLVSFRIDRLDLLAVQGTLKSLLQHHSSKASVLQRSAFFTVQLSHPYMTTGKTIPLPRQTFVGKVISLLFNMLSRLVITFLPRSKRLLISCCLLLLLLLLSRFSCV